MRLFGFEVPSLEDLGTIKHTDLNTVTPIRAPLRQPSLFGWIVESFGGSWQGNMVLENQNLLAFSAVYACVNLIAGDIAKLRPVLLRRQSSGIWLEEENASYSPVLRKPNRYQTIVQFIQHWIICKLMWGNVYVLKERARDNKVRAAYILHPSSVRAYVAPDSSVYYGIGADDLTGVQSGMPLVPADEIIHDRGPCLFHPLVGVPPVYACASSTTMGVRIQQQSNKFFSNMSRPSGHLTAPGKIDDIVAARIKREFEAGFSGDNIGRLLVTGSDLKFEPFTMPAEQAQLIEQLKFTVEDVARAFGVPLYKIAAGQTPAHTNVAALNLEYYQEALQLHIESIEALLHDGFGLAQDLKVEFDLEGLLRMDPKTLAEVDELGVKSGVLSPNEARIRRNLPPATGGNSPYLQQQNFSLAALAKRDAKEDPFKIGGPDQSGTPAPQEPDSDDDVDERTVDDLLIYSKQQFHQRGAQCGT